MEDRQAAQEEQALLTVDTGLPSGGCGKEMRVYWVMGSVMRAMHVLC
eukprot:COSAG01_NODE_1056_length_11893_cov_439.683332_4_plen_47_part_00